MSGVLDVQPLPEVEHAGHWATPATPSGPWRPRALAWVKANIEAADAIQVAGLLLLGKGCHMLLPAAGWIVPGAILVWQVLPQRPRFFNERRRETLTERIVDRARGPNGTV